LCDRNSNTITNPSQQVGSEYINYNIEIQSKLIMSC